MPHQTEAVPLANLPGSLPKAEIPDDIDIAATVTASLKYLKSLSADNLAPEAIWRDMLVLTGTLRTFYGNERIEAAWNHLSKRHKPSSFSLIPKTAYVAGHGRHSWIQAMFSFETAGHPVLKCSGIIGIIPGSNGEWRTWLLSTILEQVEGFANVDVMEPRASNAENGINGHAGMPISTSTGITNGTNGHLNAESHFDCVVVGAGMAGLLAAGRLQTLGVSTVTLERYSRIGGNWLERYDRVKLHTAKEYGHLPFSRTFPPEDPYFLSGQDLARGYQRYVDQYGINVWLSSSLESASWNGGTQSWNLTIHRHGKEVSLTTRHLVFALGSGGQIPKMPKYADRGQFKGTILHSKDYKNASQWRGKRGIVIGTANTAHDGAEDMVDANLSSITMVQRNRTAFVNRLYNAKIPTEVADREQFCRPHVVSREMGKGGLRRLASQEPERFDALERRGFKVERYPDLNHFILERLGGHYLDVGCSAKIVQGLINMKSDSGPVSYTPSGLLFADGSAVDADVIVFCTGFETNMREEVTGIVGQEIGNKLEDWWLLDKEGELRGAWKPLGHPGIWYTGGTIGHARFMSRFLAVQIKADLQNMPFERYLETPA